MKSFVVLLAFVASSGNSAFSQQALVSAQNPTNAPSTSSLPAPVTLPAAAPPVAASMSRIDPGSKVFIEPMDGFNTYLSAAMLKKKVPIVIVDDRTKADFIMVGSSQVDKAGWAKTIFISPNPHAEASISIKDAHTGNMVFAYNVDKSNAVRANQSTAEACAKHLKEAIEKK
jgi:hypothetical protein